MTRWWGRWSRSMIVTLSGIVAASGLLFVFLGDFWTDENWYYAGSWLVAHGSLPYLDFFTHHNPLVFYLYGLVQKAAGPSLLVGRVESWTFWTAAVLLLVRLAWKLGGRGAAVLFLLLVLTNPFATRFFTTFSWRPLEALLMAGALTVTCHQPWGGWRYPVLAVFLALVVVLRFPVDLGTIILGLALLYVTVRWRKKKWIVAASYGAVTLVLGVVLLPPLLYAPAQYVFDVIRYPLSLASYEKSVGLLGHLDTPVSQLFSAVRLFGEELRFFLASILLFLLTVAYGVADSRARGGGWFAWCRRREDWWWLIMAYAVIGEVLMVASQQAEPVTRIVPFVLVSLMVSVECVRLGERVLAPDAGRFLWTTVGLTLFLAPWLQDVGHAGLRGRWSSSDLFRIRRAAAAVRASTAANREILTFLPAVVTEADRPIALGMIMEAWSIFPTFDTPTSMKYRVVNVQMLLRAISDPQSGAIVLSRPGRLEDDAGVGVLLRPYRDQIGASIEHGYRRVAAVPGPRQGRTEPVSIEIYLPK